MNTEGNLSNKVCPDNMTIEEWQSKLRRESAIRSKFVVRHVDNNRIWGDYVVSSQDGSGKYRVAFRGVISEKNYCSCLDFRTNGLGTCKHVEAVILTLQKEVEGYPWANLVYEAPYSSIYVSYKGGRFIRYRVGKASPKELPKLFKKYFNSSGKLKHEYFEYLDEICLKAREIDPDFRCYDDVFEFADQVAAETVWGRRMNETYPDKAVRSGICETYPRVLQEMIYSLIKQGHGFISRVEKPVVACAMLGVVEAVLKMSDTENAISIAVLDDNSSSHNFWREMKNRFLPKNFEVISASQFTKYFMGNVIKACEFLYVEDADCLKEWRNPVSLAVKNLHPKHLYMRVETLEALTPVQISSILQHINPYVIGPFYKFIHTYRPNFPLKDDGSNLPAEMKDFTFHLPMDTQFDIIKHLMVSNRYFSDYIGKLNFMSPSSITHRLMGELDGERLADNSPKEKTTPSESESKNESRKKVKDLLESMMNVLNDREAMSILNKLLKSIS